MLPGAKNTGATTSTSLARTRASISATASGGNGLERGSRDHLQLVALGGDVVGVEDADDAHGGREALQHQFLHQFRRRAAAGDDVHLRRAHSRRGLVSVVHSGVR